jgi:hypothetical protein
VYIFCVPKLLFDFNKTFITDQKKKKKEGICRLTDFTCFLPLLCVCVCVCGGGGGGLRLFLTDLFLIWRFVVCEWRLLCERLLGLW